MSLAKMRPLDRGTVSRISTWSFYTQHRQNNEGDDGLMSNTSPRVIMFIVGVSGLCFTGCFGAKSHFATYAQEFAPNESSPFQIATVIDAADMLKRGDMPPDFNPAKELQVRLEEAMAARKLRIDPVATDAIVIVPTISDYEPGSALLRSMVVGAGYTVLAVKCRLQQHGVDVGTINARRTVEAGGIYTIGQWKLIFGAVAGDVVDALEQKVKASPHR